MQRYVPEGPYKESSYRIDVILTCEARLPSGDWIRTAKRLNNLSGGLANINGVLVPEPDVLPSLNFVPPGSYLTTCRNISITLQATCRRLDDSWQPSALDITSYAVVPGNVINDDGMLRF